MPTVAPPHFLCYEEEIRKVWNKAADNHGGKHERRAPQRQHDCGMSQRKRQASMVPDEGMNLNPAKSSTLVRFGNAALNHRQSGRDP